MTTRESIQRIVTGLQERGFDITREDVGPTFDSSNTKDDAVKWVDEYLRRPTFISRDELELYVL